MTEGLHLQKLCVGVKSPTEFRGLLIERAHHGRPLVHRTRNRPRRVAEILACEGRLYWVIAGRFSIAQPIVDFVTSDGGTNIHLSDRFVEVESWPRRPFQGWRYLPGSDAPPDTSHLEDSDPSAQEDLPPDLDAELRNLGWR